jgi:hypothetical protein
LIAYITSRLGIVKNPMTDEGVICKDGESLRPDIAYQHEQTVVIIEMKYCDDVVRAFTQARYYRKVWEKFQDQVERYIFIAINVATVEKNVDVDVAYNVEDGTQPQQNFKTPEKIKKNKTHIALRKKHPGIRNNLSKS